MAQLIQDLFTFHVFEYGHFWAAIFDLKVKMVSENVKNHSVSLLMAEITVNKTLFDFLSHLYQEMSLFLVFNMVSAAILDSHLEFES